MGWGIFRNFVQLNIQKRQIHMLIIGIAGGTGSGKTTVVKKNLGFAPAGRGYGNPTGFVL